MLFSGGLQGFIDDIACGFECATHTITHPELWGLDGSSKPAVETNKDIADLVKLLKSISGDNESLKELVAILEKMEENITEEEYNKLMEKLKEIEVKINIADLLANEPKKKEEKKEKITPEAETDEKEKINLKEAIIETPLGKKLFEHLEEEENKDDAAATA